MINEPGDVPTTPPNGVTCPESPYMAKAKRARPAAKKEAKTCHLPKNSTAKKGTNVRTEDTTDPNRRYAGYLMKCLTLITPLPINIRKTTHPTSI